MNLRKGVPIPMETVEPMQRTHFQTMLRSGKTLTEMVLATILMHFDDPAQILDSDGDDFGDYPFGNFPDECPDDYGTSYLDVYGCVDSDGDGVSDLNDQFPDNPDLWQDSDRDGIEDDIDAFPTIWAMARLRWRWFW